MHSYPVPDVETYGYLPAKDKATFAEMPTSSRHVAGSGVKVGRLRVTADS